MFVKIEYVFDDYCEGVRFVGPYTYAVPKKVNAKKYEKNEAYRNEIKESYYHSALEEAVFVSMCEYADFLVD